MHSKIRDVLKTHIKNNANKYFFLLLAFAVGISAGAFTVNGLSVQQRDELMNYFQGFMQLLENQKIENGELIRISIMENVKLVGAFWILGVTIIGIPFIYVLLAIRGFITGFSSGFIIEMMGAKGALFTALTLLPKELIMVPVFIALGVSGINFSLNIIKNKSSKHLSKESLKTSFAAYCMTTMFLSCLIFAGILVEVYISPVFVRMIAPLFMS